MTNPSAPETQTDAPEAKEAASPVPSFAADGAKSASDKLPDAGVSPNPGEAKIPPARPSTPRPTEVRPGTKLAVPPPPRLIEPEKPGPVLNHIPPPPPKSDPSPLAPEVTARPSQPAADPSLSAKPAEGIQASELAKPVVKAPRPEVKIRLFGRTDVGQVREHNEDNFIVADLTKESRGLMEADRNQIAGPRGTLLGVCDGMGGAAAGEVASQLAVDIIYQRMAIGEPPNDHDDLAARLVHAIEAAGLRIFSEAKLDRTRRGMGTTATIAALMDDHLFFGQVGDSRAYILRGERLVQVTRDQSLVNQLIEAGQLTEEEAETFEHNNIILQALGTADTVQVDLTYVVLRKGDTLLLCSDGLSGMVRNDEPAGADLVAVRRQRGLAGSRRSRPEQRAHELHAHPAQLDRRSDPHPDRGRAAVAGHHDDRERRRVRDHRWLLPPPLGLAAVGGAGGPPFLPSHAAHPPHGWPASSGQRALRAGASAHRHDARERDRVHRRARSRRDAAPRGDPARGRGVLPRRSGHARWDLREPSARRAARAPERRPRAPRRPGRA